MIGLRQSIMNQVVANGWAEDVGVAIYRTAQYMNRKDLYGACHALSSALYVALCELNMNPDLCVGECVGPDIKPFDHSWLLLDKKVVDIAISKPLPHVNAYDNIVVGGIDVVTGTFPYTIYGIKTEIGFGMETKHLISIPFVRYMDMFPGEARNGLWTVVGRILNKQIDASVLRAKYKNVQRHIT